MSAIVLSDFGTPGAPVEAHVDVARFINKSTCPRKLPSCQFCGSRHSIQAVAMATPQERHPEVSQPLNRESPRGKKRIVPMECLCLGFNRTGTVSK